MTKYYSLFIKSGTPQFVSFGGDAPLNETQSNMLRSEKAQKLYGSLIGPNMYAKYGEYMTYHTKSGVRVENFDSIARVDACLWDVLIPELECN